MGVSVADVKASGLNGDYGRVASTLVKASFPTAEVPALRAFVLKLASDNRWTQAPTVNALGKYFPQFRAKSAAPKIPSRYSPDYAAYIDSITPEATVPLPNVGVSS